MVPNLQRTTISHARKPCCFSNTNSSRGST